jgi:hypothetical protein
VATNHNPEKGPRTLSCEAWEAMLADVLDGTLDASDREAFDTHSQSCAGCGELLEEATRGSEWLRFLRETPAAPEGLLEKILAGTTGLPDTPHPMAAGAIAIPREPWLAVSVGMLHRHAAESRMLMTLAMAFFSIALTLNLTGVHLNQLKLSDLKPSTVATTVSHQYFTSYAHMRRYYENLRIVYMLESRVNEIRDNVRPSTGSGNQQPATQQQPQQKSQPQSTDKPDGAARKGSSSARPAQRQSPVDSAAPVLASDRVYPAIGPRRAAADQFYSTIGGRLTAADQFYSAIGPRLTAADRPQPHPQHSLVRVLMVGTTFLYPGDHHKPSERSLV